MAIVWSFRQIAKKCSLCGDPFKDGENVVCVVSRGGADGELERVDLHETCAKKFLTKSVVIGTWSRAYCENPDKLRDARNKIASQEEFFISLFDAERTDEGELLKQLLALILERKKIIRAFGKPANDFQRFVHTKTKKEFLIPIRDFTPDEISRIANNLELLLG